MFTSQPGARKQHEPEAPKITGVSGPGFAKELPDCGSQGLDERGIAERSSPEMRHVDRTSRKQKLKRFPSVGVFRSRAHRGLPGHDVLVVAGRWRRRESGALGSPECQGPGALRNHRSVKRPLTARGGRGGPNGVSGAASPGALGHRSVLEVASCAGRWRDEVRAARGGEKRLIKERRAALNIWLARRRRTQDRAAQW